MARTKRSSARLKIPPEEEAAFQPTQPKEPPTEPDQVLALVAPHARTDEQNPPPVPDPAEPLPGSSSLQPTSTAPRSQSSQSLTTLDTTAAPPTVINDPQPSLPATGPLENGSPPPAPLYLQNPGPPPRLPRNRNVNNLGRSSYRYKGTASGQANYRWLLWVCATLGLVILYLLLVVKIQNRTVNGPAIENYPESYSTTPQTTGQAFETVGPGEQFALVVASQARVREEPSNEARTIQNLQRYTLVALQNRVPGGWYQLKGGSGWLMAASLELYPDSDKAWTAKRRYEAATTPAP